MPAAGQRILAADFGESARAQSNTSVARTATTFNAQSPQVGTTFTPPTSGDVFISVSGGISAPTDTDWGTISYEVYEGTDGTGTVVLAAADTHGIRNAESSGIIDYKGRGQLVTGLDPTLTHFVLVMQRSGSGANITFNHRAIEVVPVP